MEKMFAWGWVGMCGYASGCVTKRANMRVGMVEKMKGGFRKVGGSTLDGKNWYKEAT